MFKRFCSAAGCCPCNVPWVEHAPLIPIPIRDALTIMAPPTGNGSMGKMNLPADPGLGTYLCCGSLTVTVV